MKHLIRNFFSTIRRYKLSSLLNVLGMAVAFATFYVILTQVSYNFGYNKKVKDADRIFLISTPSLYESGKTNFYISRPIGERLLSCSPVVESGGTATFGIGFSSARECYYIGESSPRRQLRKHINFLSKGAINTFGLEALQGSFDDLSKPYAMAISESIAQEYDLHVGDIIYGSPTAEEGGEVVVIYKDSQRNSNLAYLEMFLDMGDNNIDLNDEWSYPYYVKLKSASDKNAFEAAAKEAMRKDFQLSDEEFESIWESKHKITLIPFSALYYYDKASSHSGVSKFGNLGSDIILLSVALIIIIIALINFVNFFFAMVPIRVRSVNTYKVYGVSRSTLIGNFIGESMGLMLLSLLLGTGIAALFAKYLANDLSLTSLLISDNVLIVIITIIVALVTAVLGAIYPALYITSFTPAMVIKGSFGSSSSGRRLRNTLLAIQFVISITLIICTSFLQRQYNYMLHYNLGFDRENILAGSMPPDIAWKGERNGAFLEKLRSNPDIVDVTWAFGDLVLTNRMGWGREYNGEEINFQCYPVAYNFLDVMGISVTEGRNFTPADESSENGVIIFNEEARKQFDIKLNQIYGHNGMAEIAGCCSDLHFKPLRYGNAPFAFYVYGQHPWHSILQKIYIRTRAGANPFEVMKFVRETAMNLLPDVNHDDIELSTFDEELNEIYNTEKNLNLMIMLFTIVSIIISLMGVFGLVLFETQHRSKEIAIRRVLGADVSNILLLFNHKFFVIVLVCFAISIPISCLIIQRYLSTFAYHISIVANWWIFGLALVLVLAATLAVINIGCYKTATSNPVNHIKTE